MDKFLQHDIKDSHVPGPKVKRGVGVAELYDYRLTPLSYFMIFPCIILSSSVRQWCENHWIVGHCTGSLFITRWPFRKVSWSVHCIPCFIRQSRQRRKFQSCSIFQDLQKFPEHKFVLRLQRVNFVLQVLSQSQKLNHDARILCLLHGKFSIFTSLVVNPSLFIYCLDHNLRDVLSRFCASYANLCASYLNLQIFFCFLSTWISPRFGLM